MSITGHLHSGQGGQSSSPYALALLIHTHTHTLAVSLQSSSQLACTDWLNLFLFDYHCTSKMELDHACHI